MWTKDAETTTSVAPDAIWATWTKPDNWPKFDEQMDWVKLSPFTEGTTGTIKMKKQPRPSPLTISRLDAAGLVFEIRSKVPMARLHFEHSVEAAPGGGSRIWQRSTIEGPLSAIWGRIIGKDIAAGMPTRLVALAELAGKEAPAP